VLDYATTDATAYYVYDKNGNRTQVTRNGSSSTYSVDDNDKFLYGDGLSASGYDLDGNPGSIFVPGEGIYGFEYDHENRPWRTTRPGGSQVYYNYDGDGDGRRVEKTLAGIGTTRYVYDGDTVIAEVTARLALQDHPGLLAKLRL